MAEQNMPFHNHPLLYEASDKMNCSLCGVRRATSGYRCKECDFLGHKECIERSLNHPFHCKHPFKILLPKPTERVARLCHFCRQPLEGAYFHCFICNISVDHRCLINQPELTLYHPKNHEHKVTLLPRVVTFTCNACGLEGGRNPYICLECNWMVHRDCVYLPRVIRINRHDHRISRTYHLGEGEWESCGVCRQNINWVYGAFVCSLCPNYAVHSKCATRDDVWDGEELEDLPEEEEEDVVAQFMVIKEKEIIHFSHQEHHLRLNEDYVSDNDYMRCEGCVLPIYDVPFYKCVECHFYLHKECANLPRKKRQMLHNRQLTLQVHCKDEASTFLCLPCGQYSNGFRYEYKGSLSFRRGKNVIDVRCFSINEPFYHELHQHPLYCTSRDLSCCEGCGEETVFFLTCIVSVCQYRLCFGCVTLPRKVKDRCDDHFLSLGHGAGSASGDFWCDICETKTDPNVWYYTCEECGPTLRIKCVLGDLYYMKQGYIKAGVEVLPNNGATRPFCSVCRLRCRFPFLLKFATEQSVKYICSLKCDKDRMQYSKVVSRFDFLPWWEEKNKATKSTTSSQKEFELKSQKRLIMFLD